MTTLRQLNKAVRDIDSDLLEHYFFVIEKYCKNGAVSIRTLSDTDFNKWSDLYKDRKIAIANRAKRKRELRIKRSRHKQQIHATIG